MRKMAVRYSNFLWRFIQFSVALGHTLKRYSGWSPMYVFNRGELEPYPVDNDIIECWLGRAEPGDAGHADFWRVSADGKIVLVRGHQEDGIDFVNEQEGKLAGTSFETTLPAWRTAEFIRRVRELGEKMAAGEFRLQFVMERDGLAGRKLFSNGNRRGLLRDYMAHDQAYRVETEVSPGEVDVALATIVAAIVSPLLRKFSFFEPPQRFYDEELRRMRSREYT